MGRPPGGSGRGRSAPRRAREDGSPAWGLLGGCGPEAGGAGPRYGRLWVEHLPLEAGGQDGSSCSRVCVGVKPPLRTSSWGRSGVTASLGLASGCSRAWDGGEPLFLGEALPPRRGLAGGDTALDVPRAWTSPLGRPPRGYRLPGLTPPLHKLSPLWAHLTSRGGRIGVFEAEWVSLLPTISSLCGSHRTWFPVH